MSRAFAWLEPSYVPSPFKHFGTVEGDPAGEFWDDPNQIAVRYRRATSFAYLPITIAWTPRPNATLVGTDQRVGDPVKVHGLTARYHNGTWAPGPGPEQVDTPVGPLHWETSLEHSITLHTASGSFAVRAPRDSVRDSAELARIISSVAVPQR